MTDNNYPNLDLVNINAYTKFVEILSFCSQDIEGKRKFEQILTSIKGNNSIINACKMRCNNPKLDLININTYTKFGEILSICSEDIEQKRKPDGQNDGQPKSSIAPLIQSGATIR